MSIGKEYKPDEVEAYWVETWGRAETFQAQPDSAASPFCMVIPPPNVTGELHIGHVLVYTLHDIVARWRRMQGRDVLWLPGTDHAGIATQMVVERELAREGRTRADLGREAFERRVWEWKETYGDRINGSLRRLGASVDWTRERFTLDQGLSRAVRTVFVQLYRDGLIYRDRYIVNWCPRCHTALSDLEAVHESESGKLWRIRYVDPTGSPGVVVATTRPETLFGDTAVAVHPDDPRFQAFIGKHVRVPLTDRTVPVVADSFVDPTFGTGAVKITPAHDPNDFHAGRRLNLPQIVALDSHGKMTEAAGSFCGQDRFEARRQVVEALAEAGLLEGVQEHALAVARCQRCSTVVEPHVSDQWFVRVAPLAEPAIQAVESGSIRFVPDNWAKTYFEWMRNIHDWCISRQLWWGHQIPAWHCQQCAAIQVTESAPSTCDRCGGSVVQDPDVLDTWFSSALWPFSTLGWPDKSSDLARYYPTDLLITGHDIIFFWVARMIMMGLRFMGDVPFREVYIHGLVRDAQGQKMSKSKGNTVNPAEVQARYGTDAVRFTMAVLAAPGNDIPLAPERMEGYRAFANKLWNASRFVLLKASTEETAGAVDSCEPPFAERWIRSRLQVVIGEANRSLESYRFDRAAEALYHFVWGEYCDWYIEWVKPDLAEAATPAQRMRARATLVEVLGTALRLLHPFMPFVTAELWRLLPDSPGDVATAPWPTVDPRWIDPAVDAEAILVQEIIAGIRNVRAQSNIEPGLKIEVLLRVRDAEQAAIVARHVDLIRPLARAGSVRVITGELPTAGVARGVVRGVEIAVPLAGLVDVEAERSRLRRDLDKISKEIITRAERLEDPGFCMRAPPAVVEKERLTHRELAARADRLREALSQLDVGGAT